MRVPVRPSAGGRAGPRMSSQPPTALCAWLSSSGVAGGHHGLLGSPVLVCLGSFIILHFLSLFTVRSTWYPQELTFQNDAWRAHWGKGRAISWRCNFDLKKKKKKKLFHKPHCCVTAKWAVRGRRCFPRFNRKHSKD